MSKVINIEHRKEAIEAVVRKTYVPKSEADMEKEIDNAQRAYALGANLFYSLKGRDEADSWEGFKKTMLDTAEELGSDGWNQLIKEGEEIE